MELDVPLAFLKKNKKCLNLPRTPVTAPSSGSSSPSTHRPPAPSQSSQNSPPSSSSTQATPLSSSVTDIHVSSPSRGQDQVGATLPPSCEATPTGPCAPDLPPFSPIPSSAIFTWGDSDADSLTEAVMSAYKEVLHWQKNLFPVPHGNIGRSFVNELSRLYKAYAAASSLEGVALAAACIMPTLLLQNPSPRSKTRDHITYLERRLNSWEKGDILALVEEGRSIQRQFKPRHTSRKAQVNLANRLQS